MNIVEGKFIVIDGNSLANRAFYAIPMLSNSQGVITNAVYGFCNMLFKIIDEEKPQYIAVAFDKGKYVFRHKEYADYKGQRKGTPEELRTQFPILKDLLKAMNVAIFECENYEADDIIGTLVKLAEEENLESLIVTGDKDALQLASEKTKVLLTKKGISQLEIYDEKAIVEKYQLNPEQIIDLKGLMGDASDNIPGIPGVGKKTALKLLWEYKDVENVLNHSSDFQGKKLGKLLEEYKDQALLSKKLATIYKNVPLTAGIAECEMEEPDYPQVMEMLKELEFKNILQNMRKKMFSSAEHQADPQEITGQGELIQDSSSLDKYLKAIQDNLCLYVETEKIGVCGFKLTGIGIKGPNQNPIYVDITADEGKELLAGLKPYLEKESVTITTHDVKHLHLVLDMYGIKLKGTCYDIMLMSYLLHPARAKNDLVSLVEEEFTIPPEQEGADLIYYLLAGMEKLAPQLKEELEQHELWHLYKDMELPLARVLAVMEKTGLQLDEAVLEKIGQELEGRIEELTKRIYALAGEEFNINSPKQLGVILFEKLGLPQGKKTKTGYSTNAEVLEFLAHEHEIAATILEYRQLVKLKSTYIDGLRAIIDPATKKVYTTFNQAVTATGRLSSTEPNLQNIPIRMEEGRRIRKAFLASPGHMLLSADYSQIELRVLAHIAHDEVLREAFQKNQDIHTRTAAEVFEIPMTEVNKEMRRAAKAVNFGIVYGISDYGLSRDLGITRKEAKEYINNYFKRYYGVKTYLDTIVNEAREQGYVTTLLKRRRYLPDILSRNYHLRSFAERTAMNTPIQGSAADIIKLAMLKIQEIIDKEDAGITMLLQVHDELIFDVPEDKVESFGKLVSETMGNVYPLTVPLKVDLQAGPNWYDLKPLQV